jgi:hypothetical protein
MTGVRFPVEVKEPAIQLTPAPIFMGGKAAGV